ncbi:MAG: glycosyltransferase family 4 protein [Dehalococcoidia bacterium]
MKVALVSPYDFAYPGGVSVHIFHMERNLTRMGHEVKIIAPCSRGPAYDNPNLISLGRPIPIPSGGSMARITLSLRLSSPVKAILERENFDVINLHEPLTPMLPLTVLRQSREINIGTFHACHNTPRGYGLSKHLLGRWVRKLHGRVAVSPAAMGFVSRHFPGDYRIIPNGVDLELFSPQAAPREEFRDGKQNILFVGRLEKRKGLEYLLGAYGRLKRELPDIRLIIVGPGTKHLNGYEKHVRERGLEDVVFAGLVPYDELPGYYASADIFCAPATGEESFGIVLLEAMASGRPVIASRNEGYRQLVTHDVEGLLFPPREEEALTQALRRLLIDRDLGREMGARGRHRAQEYSWEKIARMSAEFYLEKLSGSERPVPTLTPV